MPKSKSGLVGRGVAAGSPGFLGGARGGTGGRASPVAGVGAARGGTGSRASLALAVVGPRSTTVGRGSVRGSAVGGSGDGLVVTGLGLSSRGLLAGDPVCGLGGRTSPGATSSPGKAEPLASSAPSSGGSTSMASPCSDSCAFSSGIGTLGSASRGGAAMGGAAAGSAASDLVAWSRAPLPATGDRPTMKMTTAAAAHTTSPATKWGR